MARAHQLGQTNKVKIYILITRGTIEERMMGLTKKKMILEHLVVGKLKTQNINQEELDGIIRHGSMELFADESEEAKARQIHYDDAAIDRILDREHVGEEETSLDEEEEDGFLKAFKVANFEYIDEVEASAEEEIQKAAMESKAAANNPDRLSYWEELLRGKYEVHKTEEFNALGKGKRSRKQLASVEDDDLAGLEDVSSDGEDDNYEGGLSDSEMAPAVAPSGRRPYRKRNRVDGMELPLMEGEGKSFRVRGFNQSQRALFVQILMRFGVGDYDWVEFVPRLKGKTYDEINEYGMLFLSHLVEEVNDLPTFSDGVPKEGLRVQDVLARIGQLELIAAKVKLLSKNPGAPLLSEDVLFHYPALRGGRVWKREHDSLLLRAVTKHGYGRWQAIIDDKTLRLQELISQELNLPLINLPGSGGNNSQTQSGLNQSNAESSGGDAMKGVVNNGENGATIETTPAAVTDSGILYHYREMQRRQVEFVKKRVLLLEKGLFAEYHKENSVGPAQDAEQKE